MQRQAVRRQFGEQADAAFVEMLPKVLPEFATPEGKRAMRRKTFFSASSHQLAAVSMVYSH
jgi:hypothetical protein